MATERTMQRPAVSSWAVGFAVLAGSLMFLTGIFQVFQGLIALFNGNFYAIGANYILTLDITTWGWVHLLTGFILAVAGVAVFSGRLWARTIGILLAIISAAANFFFIPYYPLWSMLIIAMDIGIIWALAVYGRDEAMAARGR